MVAVGSIQMMNITNMCYFPSSLKFKECFIATSDFDSFSLVQGKGKGKGIPRIRGIVNTTRKRVYCKLQDGDDRSSNSSNNEPPESLFMKELRRRGITPTSVLEESNTTTIEEEIIEDGVGGRFPKRNAVATDSDKSLTNQREQSMALNSEGLEGLIPRGKLLLRLGGTFFLAFWPLIIITVGSFAALYLYFGPTFVHDGTKTASSLPQYIDPYKLLEEERIIQ